MHTLATRTLPPPPADLLTGASLFLDFDGTLVELQDKPHEVRVSEALSALMARLMERMPGRVAVVSGRSYAQIQEMFGAPKFAVSGSHGLELVWPDGRRRSPDLPDALGRVRQEMRGLRSRYPQLIVEEKPFGTAFHYRLAPEAEAESHALARRLAEETGLQLQTGKMMIEVRLGGADKGAAIHALMQEPAMAGTRPVFIGDDDTDEPGFVAAEALGGAGVLVGPPRRTAARFGLSSVDATLAWLQQACGEVA
jgi:trehalose 6-phosphate phosphatase